MVFANPAAQTFGGVISGGGSLGKIGTGTLTLAATQTYGGPTAINAGTVRLGSGSGAGGPIAGFGADTSGGGNQSNGTWTFNTTAVPTTAVTGGTLTLTDGLGGEARTAFYNTPVTVNSPFTASFIYTAGTAAGSQNGYLADGFCFILQNSGTGALGGTGGQLGYGGISPSAAVATNIFSYIGAGTNYGTNGTTPSSYLGGASGLWTYNFDPPMQYTLTYDGSSTLTETVQAVATPSTSFSTTYTVGSLASVVGGNTAYMGFSGSTGGSYAFQYITSFSGSFNVSLGTSVNILPTTTDLSIALGATLDLNGGSQQVDSLSGSGTITNSAQGEAAFSVNGSTSTIFNGTINNGVGGTALVMSGGTLTLSGTNTFTGGTFVDGGTLIVTNNKGLRMDRT